MNSDILDRSLIRNPHLWNLYIALGDGKLEVMAYNNMEDNSLVTADIALDGNNALKAFENVVYDNPLLLGNFRRVTFLIRDTPHAVIPTSLLNDSPSDARKVIDELIGASPDEPVIDNLPLLDTSIAYRIDTDIYNFINRTFTGARFCHRLTGLTRFWHGTNRVTGAPATHVYVRSDGIDIIVFAGKRLLLANSYHTPAPTDRLYYVMAVRQLTDASVDTPVVIAGERSLRDELTGMLATHVDNVVPDVFPAAMFRAGGQTAINTPLDLVVMPLCE